MKTQIKLRKKNVDAQNKGKERERERERKERKDSIFTAQQRLKVDTAKETNTEVY